MDYSYLGSGNISTKTCTDYSYTILIFIKYKIGNTLFIKAKALKGIAEKVVIKKVKLFPYKETERPYNEFCKSCNIKNISPLYIDTLNAYHNESDLVTSTQAISLIEKFKAIEINPCLR